ncbi:DUF523 domain-containing protein [Proteocatella sphenisci]|uniref:DUF523 domain-containing protein n=1 Tax=Proteocatella sphenisci TaxID=181070 RepID=UPI00048D27FC|nr:DUF523 domain-containing protein [Proteocatella sphenisci]
MVNILVSACLLGLNCKYSGGNNINERIVELKNRYNLIPVCPEQLGGLATPRNPAEICKGLILDSQGKDVTEYFKKGAMETLALARLFNCPIAILKSKSPSCGINRVYDGTFEGRLISGMGMTARLLKESGITVMCDEDI